MGEKARFAAWLAGEVPMKAPLRGLHAMGIATELCTARRIVVDFDRLISSIQFRLIAIREPVMLCRVLACLLVTFCYVGGVSAATWNSASGAITIDSDIDLKVKIEYLIDNPGFVYLFAYNDGVLLAFQTGTSGVPEPVVGGIYSLGLLGAAEPFEFDFGAASVDVSQFGSDIFIPNGSVTFAGFGTDVLALDMFSSDTTKVATLLFGEESAIHPSGSGGGTGPSPIPLPAAGWLLFAGLGALAAAARRRAG